MPTSSKAFVAVTVVDNPPHSLEVHNLSGMTLCPWPLHVTISRVFIGQQWLPKEATTIVENKVGSECFVHQLQVVQPHH